MSVSFEPAVDDIRISRVLIGSGLRRSISSRCWTAFAVLLLSLLLPRLAMADYPNTYFAVKCDSAHNRVLIRFVVIDRYLSGGTITPQDFPDAPGTMYEVPSLPASIKARWKGIPYHIRTAYHIRTVCTLRNDQKISLSQQSGAAGQGMDEAIPDVSFTMKINDQFIYFDSLLLDAEGRHPQGLVVSAIEYTGKKLLACYPVEKNKHGAVRPSSECVDESKRLLPGYKYLTQWEKDELDQYRRKQHLEAKVTPLCKALLGALNTLEPRNGVTFYFSKKHEWGANGRMKSLYSTAKFSLYNDGIKDYVAEYGFYELGELTHNKNFIFDFGRNKKAFDAFIKYIHSPDIDGWYVMGLNSKKFGQWKRFYVGISKKTILSLKSFQWLIIYQSLNLGDSSGGFINTAIGYHGKTFIFTMLNAPYDPPQVPYAIIREPMPDKSEKLICALPETIEPDLRF